MRKLVEFCKIAPVALGFAVYHRRGALLVELAAAVYLRSFAIASFLFFCGIASALDERDREMLTCQPVNGYIELPGIKYDDLTPLARDVFRGNTAVVSNTLYALPMAEREDFITLYLEPSARERHRRFFSRCRAVAERRALGKMIEGGDILPPLLRQELMERDKVRLALHDGAVPFRLGDRNVFIPVPEDYVPDDGPLGLYLRERGVIDSLAVFGKKQALETGREERPARPILASITDVREGSDTLRTILEAYRTMVDSEWRLTGMHPADSPLEIAETLEYKWNLQPFHIRDNSFCYGQFEKTTDIHGVNDVRYRATAVITLPGCYIQVSVLRAANTALGQVDEMNGDILHWRDAILAANWQYLEEVGLPVK